MKLRFAAITDVGGVRPNNEDQVLADEPLFAVADGMGGHAAGEVASQVAIETLKSHFHDDPTAAGLASAVHAANNAVWARAQEKDDTRGMGTTMTAAALVEQDGEQVLEVANVGDSRAYLLRDSELEQLSDDHSLVEDLVRAGRLSPEEALNHPQRHIVTRVLGMEDRDGTALDVEVDTFTVVPYRGDRLLLATDGLTDMVTDDQIASVLRRLADPDDAAKELVRLAKAGGGNDNISLVIVDVVDDDGKAGTASAALADEPAPPSRDPEPSARINPSPTRTDPRGSDGKRARPARTAPRLTVRTVGFVVAVLALLVVAVGAITWYAKGSYYVGTRTGNVAVYRGRPGGFLWVKPTLVDRTSLRAKDVPASRQAQLGDGQPEPTRRAARHYIDNLRAEAEKLAPPTSTTVTNVAGTPPTTVAP
ncbi:MAG: Stp1/IreP family PP2C-type Ser/Thr phosphatase [Actinobacteria bacterium]|nr:Stp1/IreP family PP2C-type Ser/Thr phosphatase [Actinomycetota bacterium]